MKMKNSFDERITLIKQMPKEYSVNKILMLVLIKIVLILISIGMLYVYRMFIDEVLLDSNKSIFLLVVLFTISLWTLETFFNYIFEYFFIKNIKSKTYMLRGHLIRKYGEMDFNKCEKKTIGDYYETIITDSNSIEQFVQMQIIEYITSLIYTITLGFILLGISFKLSLISLLAVPVSFYLTYRFGLNFQQKVIEYRKLYGEYIGWLFNSLKNSEKIKTLDWEKITFIAFTGKWKTLMKLFFEKHLNWCMNRTFISIKDFLFTKLLIYFVGGLLIFRNDLTLGSLLIFIKFFDDFFTNINLLSDAEMNLKQNKVGINRVYQFLKGTEESWGESSLSKIERLELRNLKFSYDEIETISDIDITFKLGSINVLIGESGSGKSTLSKLIASILEPKCGELLINNLPCRSFKRDAFYSKVGYLPQVSYLFKGSLRDNITCGNVFITDEEIFVVLRKIGLLEYVENLEDGLDFQIVDQNSLSGGQKQLLCIARLLLKDTNILILDESTSALDVRLEKMVLSYLREISSNKIIIIVAHRMETILSADNTIILNKGRKIHEGNHEELIEMSDYYFKLASAHNQVS